MAENRFNFTESRLAKVHRAPIGKRDVYYDEEQANLCLIVTDKGHKAFYVRVTHMGRPVRSHLGSVDSISLKDARTRTRDFLTKLSANNNPHQAKVAIKREPTLQQLYNAYLPHAKATKRSWVTEKYNFEKNVPPALLSIKASRIQRDDMVKLKGQVADSAGLMAANRLLCVIQAMYAYGVEHGHITCPSPVRGIKKFKQTSRDRFLSGDELKAFMQALESESDPLYKDFFYTCLLTGARKGNVLAMMWGHLNLEEGVWHINHTKNGESQNVVLPPELITLLKERRKTAKSLFVFPSPVGTKHLADPKKAWSRLLQRAGIKDLRIHDLRRTLGSWQAMLGSSLLVIGKSLGHKTSRATEIYSKLTLDPVRESVTQAANKILEFRK